MFGVALVASSLSRLDATGRSTWNSSASDRVGRLRTRDKASGEAPGEAPQDIRDAPLSAAFLRDTPWADIVQRDNTHGHRRSNRLIVKFRIGP